MTEQSSEALLLQWMSDHDHSQEPADVRWRGCVAHNEGMACCLDYFYDAIMALLLSRQHGWELALLGELDGTPRSAVRLLTGLTDEQLDDLGGFPDEGHD